MQWGVSPQHAASVFKRFSSPPDGDTALRRLEEVQLIYFVLDQGDAIYVVPEADCHPEWQTPHLTLSDAFREAETLAGVGMSFLLAILGLGLAMYGGMGGDLGMALCGIGLLLAAIYLKMDEGR